jgi:hypothetical protein
MWGFLCAYALKPNFDHWLFLLCLVQVFIKYLRMDILAGVQQNPASYSFM